MDINFNEFEKYYYDLVYNNLEIEKFESWIYSYEDLESILNEEDYIELISLNFNNRYIKYEIQKILDRYIDYSKFEKKRVLSLLYIALESRNDLPDALRSFYYMYCDGYYFFEDLGLGYGLTCQVPPSNYCAETWEELNDKEQNEIINSFYPYVERDIKRAINWIERDKIILTGIKNELEHWKFIDNRTDEEKKSVVLTEESSNNAYEAVINNTLSERKDKKWWEFWKK